MRKAGAADTAARAVAEVDRRLAAYRPVETDARAVEELDRIIRSGLVAQADLPFVPAAPEPIALADPSAGRRHNRRRDA